MTHDDGPRISGLTTAVYRFPTPEPEADGTLQWDATTAVTVTLTGGGRTGLGWTYSKTTSLDYINTRSPSTRRRGRCSSTTAAAAPSRTGPPACAGSRRAPCRTRTEGEDDVGRP